MPVKSKHRKAHHTAHKKERRTKDFLKAYAPFIPLLLIVSTGIAIMSHGEFAGKASGHVQSYATNMSDDGLLTETNKRRAEQGLKPLAFNNQLDDAAQAKAQDMANKNYWSHNTPDGKEPWIFIEATDYKFRKAAENLAYGFQSSESTLNGWMNSPGHRANVLDKDLEQVGFGIVNVAEYQDHGQQTIVVAIYGSPALAAQAPTQQPATTVASESPQSISFIQSLTAGKAPWSGFAIGLVLGGILMYLTVTHARGLRRAALAGENFVVHHPLFDITLVALLALIIVASQSIGAIY